MAKILIVRMGAFGDILHALPAVTGIRAALPDATIGWLVEDNWSELLVAQRTISSASELSAQKPVVNLVHSVNTRRWRRRMYDPATAREAVGVIKKVRAAGYDAALDFQANVKSAIFAAMSRAPIHAGFADPRERLAGLFYSQQFPRESEHVVEQNHSLAAQALHQYLGSAVLTLPAPQLPRDAASEAWVEAEIKKLGIASFAIVNPGAGWGGKQWPAERFGELAKALARHNLKTLVNFGPGEADLAQVVVRASDGNAFPVGCTVGQLIAVTRRARILIGGDTGPLHLAAALEVPVVGLYGPTDPARTGPFGTQSITLRHPDSETTFSHHRRPDEGLLKIEAQDVIAAARQLLGSSHA
jgi:heptosyltransferase-1